MCLKVFCEGNEKQYEDLKNAENSLQDTITKINKTARKQFLDTFNSISENFSGIFNNFFVNGEGTIKLEENVDPLEANVEILVRPKSKRLQTLNLLSGGEKNTHSDNIVVCNIFSKTESILYS